MDTGTILVALGMMGVVVTMFFGVKSKADGASDRLDIVEPRVRDLENTLAGLKPQLDSLCERMDETRGDVKELLGKNRR